MSNYNFEEHVTSIIEQMIEPLHDEIKMLKQAKKNELEKLYYSLKEISMIIPITVKALKARISRCTLIAVRSQNQIMVHRDDLTIFLSKLEKTKNRKKK